MDSMATIKKLEPFKQKAQAPIGQAGRVHMNTKVTSENQEAHLNCPCQIQCSPFNIKN